MGAQLNNHKQQSRSFTQATIKAAKSLGNSLPVLVGVILLISLITVIIPSSAYSKIFTGNPFLDPLIGGLLGSILAGNPITSYIIGGELLSQGISLLAVTAFIVAWVTVGLVQYPAESYLLGKRFAIARNISAFIFSLLVAVVVVMLL